MCLRQKSFNDSAMEEKEKEIRKGCKCMDGHTNSGRISAHVSHMYSVGRALCFPGSSTGGAQPEVTRAIKCQHHPQSFISFKYFKSFTEASSHKDVQSSYSINI